MHPVSPLRRGCGWIKHNDVIGIGGKGYQARIVFDLDQPMAQSNCVSCGECAASCPTGALSFSERFLNHQTARVERELFLQQKDGWIVDPQLLVQQPLFQGLPLKYLQLHGVAVLQRALKPGDVLCRQGDPGGTAYIITKGSFDVSLEPSSQRAKVPGLKSQSQREKRSWWSRLRGIKDPAEEPDGQTNLARLADFGGREIAPDEIIRLDSRDVIYAEASCWNRTPRSATVIAREEAEVLEIRRNVLELLLQAAHSRETLEAVYKQRAIHQLKHLELFAKLDTAQRLSVAEKLKDRIELVHVDPGQVIFSQGERSTTFTWCARVL